MGCKVSAWDRAVLVATEGLLGNKWVGEGVETGAKTRSWATAVEWSRPPLDTAPWATAGVGDRGWEQTPDERVGSRQPQTSDHCRLQLQDAQTQNVRSARWFPGVPESREHNGTEFGSDSNHAAHGIAARFPRTRL